jgi:hypothetical protein
VQVVLGVMEGGGAVANLHADAAAGLGVDFRAQLLEQALDILEFDVRADRMIEQGMQNFAMTMVHSFLMSCD